MLGTQREPVCRPPARLVTTDFAASTTRRIVISRILTRHNVGLHGHTSRAVCIIAGFYAAVLKQLRAGHSDTTAPPHPYRD